VFREDLDSVDRCAKASAKAWAVVGLD